MINFDDVTKENNPNWPQISAQNINNWLWIWKNKLII